MIDKVLPITQATSLSHIVCSSKQHQLLVQLHKITYEKHENLMVTSLYDLLVQMLHKGYGSNQTLSDWNSGQLHEMEPTSLGGQEPETT